MEFKQAHSTNFRKGRTKPIQFIVIHYTSNDNDTAKGNLDYYARSANLKASAHYYVDRSGVCQSVKDTDTAYHCGATTYKHKTCRNDNSIGIELCSRYTGKVVADKNAGTVDFRKYYFDEDVIANAVKLTKELMQKYGIPATNVIRHYDVTGKTCPAPFVIDEKQWKEFLAMVTAPDKKIESGNDIVWELMNGPHKIKITEVQKAINALDKAKNDSTYASLYWILYKLVNGNG